LESIKAKFAVWAQDKALVKAAAALLGALLIALVFLCISINMRANIQEKYSAARHELQEQGYQELISMTELFARIDDPTVDVRYKLIPSMKADYDTVIALNDALVVSYGQKHAILTPEQISAFDAAFERFNEAYRTDSATGLAEADMSACIEEVQSMIDKRYAPEDDPEDDVVIIDASSGQIQEK